MGVHLRVVSVDPTDFPLSRHSLRLKESVLTTFHGREACLLLRNNSDKSWDIFQVLLSVRVDSVSLVRVALNGYTTLET
jgi:hypothetical protein